MCDLGDHPVLEAHEETAEEGPREKVERWRKEGGDEELP